MAPDFRTSKQIAMRYPCRFAFETAQPKFGSRIKYGLSLVLTINNGYE